MPIYEYFCPRCNFKFELLRPLSRVDEVASCPHCHNKARRVFSSFASLAEDSEETPTPNDGSSSCGTCSATNCATCRGF